MGSPAPTTIMKLLVLLITLTGAMATDPEFRFLFQTITRVTTLTKTATTTSTVLPACVSNYAALPACVARKKRSPRDLSVELLSSLSMERLSALTELCQLGLLVLNYLSLKSTPPVLVRLRLLPRDLPIWTTSA